MSVTPATLPADGDSCDPKWSQEEGGALCSAFVYTSQAPPLAGMLSMCSMSCALEIVLTAESRLILHRHLRYPLRRGKMLINKPFLLGNKLCHWEINSLRGDVVFCLVMSAIKYKLVEKGCLALFTMVTSLSSWHLIMNCAHRDDFGGWVQTSSQADLRCGRALVFAMIHTFIPSHAQRKEEILIYK